MIMIILYLSIFNILFIIDNYLYDKESGLINLENRMGLSKAKIFLARTSTNLLINFIIR
ncbi:hypothetical protein SERIO_v1c07200 [Spiroplasma eriocheiris]|uniref:Uncharacterized protein n=2 Tax=Spiroplasma eriocheiris TaxID=315358 RepID=A0A0H3XLB1_9MOLU|nr:hypothetical protein SERIO_v1c07200 [Spiroplasma eriocheiris]